MFRSLFRDHPQESSFVLSAPTTYQPPASSFVYFGFVAVCPLLVCVSGVPVCVLLCFFFLILVTFFNFVLFLLSLCLYFASFCILSSESCGYNLGISWQPLEPFVAADFHHAESSNPNVPSLSLQDLAQPLENTIEFNVEMNYNLGHRSEALTPIHFPCFKGRKAE
jgi:hypothetical protein